MHSSGGATRRLPWLQRGLGCAHKVFSANLFAVMQGAQSGTATRCAVGCSLYVYIQAASNGTL